MGRRLTGAGLVALLVLAVVLSGCRFLPGSRQPSGQTQGTQEQLPPGKANILTMLGADPPTLDPALTTDATSATYIVEIFSGLVTFNKDLQIVPDLAERWDVSPDGRTYTFYLRKNAKFHNGKQVTAQDFKYSIERAADPRTQSTVADTYLGDIVGVKEMLSGQARQVSGVKVIDDYTLQIQIDAPKVYFLAKLTYPTAFVVDKENVESGRNWMFRPNGTGPFKLREWRVGERIVLERNENYYLGAPKLERVIFILSGGSAMTMYENNEIDITGVGIDDIERVLDPNSPLRNQLLVANSFSVGYIGFNVTKPPFDDRNVRLALSYAIDKDKLAEVVLRKFVDPAYGILPPGFPGYNANLTGIKFDPQWAKQLLAQSKYGTSLPPITLTIPGAAGNPPRTTSAIIEMWRQNLGIEVQVQQVEWATFLDDLKRYRYQAFELGWIADYPDPQNFLDILFHSQSLDNTTRYSNPEVDRLLEQARTESDPQRRTQLYQQVEQIIIQDAPWIPLTFGKEYVLVKPWVKNYVVSPIIIPVLKDVVVEPH
jgi:oligopeptide transport system substrate-binding protein